MGLEWITPEHAAVIRGLFASGGLALVAMAPRSDDLRRELQRLRDELTTKRVPEPGARGAVAAFAECMSADKEATIALIDYVLKRDFDRDVETQAIVYERDHQGSTHVHGVPTPEQVERIRWLIDREMERQKRLDNQAYLMQFLGKVVKWVSMVGGGLALIMGVVLTWLQILETMQ